MTTNTLLNTLVKVKQTNHSTWIACCPAHDDKNPSLAIRQVDDGRILIHCFAGCPTESVLNAVNLSFSDIQPEQLNGNNFKPLKRIFNAHTALEILRYESLITLETAKSLDRGEILSEDSLERLKKCIERIERVCEAGGLA